MKFLKICTAIVFSSTLINTAFAHEESENSNCTDAAITAAENYDAGLSDVTTCIKKREGVKVVVAWNNNLFNGKIFKTTGASVGQQAVNVRNLARDYENNYNMEHGEEFRVVVVAYASGLDWLRKSTDQANRNMVNSLMAKGIQIYACQNTMKAKKLKLADLLPGVKTVPAGVSAVVDLQTQGMTYINP